MGRQLILYCTPTKSGLSRIFYIMLADGQRLSKLQRLITAVTPKWIKFARHFVQNDTLDGDNIFLHVQVCCPKPPQMPACRVFPLLHVTFMNGVLNAYWCAYLII